MKKLWVFTGILILCLGQANAQEFSAFLSKNKVAVGETFQVSFRLTNLQRQAIDYPDLSDFQLLGGPNVSQSVQMMNGKTTQSITYSFYLRPVKEGSFVIGPASTKISGKKVSTKPLKVTVAAGKAATNPNARNQAKNAQANNQDLEKQIREALFLRTLISKRDVYQGEQITVTYKLYNQIQPYELELTKAPAYDGFWKENVKIADAPQKVEVYKDEQYRTRVIYQDIIFPQRSGKMAIDPMELSCVIQVQTQSRRRRSIFDDFFPSYQQYPYKFGGQKVAINVKPLPAGKPADFSGLVGKLNMDMSLDKTETETGSPITVKVKLSGQGNMRKLSEPELQFPADFEVYDPQIKESSSRAGGILGGSRTYEYLVIPANPGTFEIPPLTLSYFDPESGSYKTVSSRAYSIRVVGEPTGRGPGPTVKQEVSVLEEDIRYIETGGIASWEKFEEKEENTALYWGAFGMPFIFLFILLAYKRRNDARSADVVGSRKRKATKLALSRLKGAKTHMEANDQKAFYNEVIRAIWGYLGDKLNMGQSEMSKENIKEKLSQRNVSEGNTNILKDILDSCEMALFAPSAVGQDMQQTYDQAVLLISDIENEITD
ncbi:MAG: BatD family protein [Bacteroidia bacterium]|nr:BatD family protein [Bacteroidia bacterium]